MWRRVSRTDRMTDRMTDTSLIRASGLSIHTDTGLPLLRLWYYLRRCIRATAELFSFPHLKLSQRRQCGESSYDSRTERAVWMGPVFSVQPITRNTLCHVVTHIVKWQIQSVTFTISFYLYKLWYETEQVIYEHKTNLSKLVQYYARLVVETHTQANKWSHLWHYMFKRVLCNNSYKLAYINYFFIGKNMWADCNMTSKMRPSQSLSSST